MKSSVSRSNSSDSFSMSEKPEGEKRKTPSLYVLNNLLSEFSKNAKLLQKLLENVQAQIKPGLLQRLFSNDKQDPQQVQLSESLQQISNQLNTLTTARSVYYQFLEEFTCAVDERKRHIQEIVRSKISEQFKALENELKQDRHDDRVKINMLKNYIKETESSLCGRLENDLEEVNRYLKTAAELNAGLEKFIKESEGRGRLVFPAGFRSHDHEIELISETDDIEQLRESIVAIATKLALFEVSKINGMTVNELDEQLNHSLTELTTLKSSYEKIEGDYNFQLKRLNNLQEDRNKNYNQTYRLLAEESNERQVNRNDIVEELKSYLSSDEVSRKAIGDSLNVRLSSREKSAAATKKSLLSHVAEIKEFQENLRSIIDKKKDLDKQYHDELSLGMGGGVINNKKNIDLNRIMKLKKSWGDEKISEYKNSLLKSRNGLRECHVALIQLKDEIERKKDVNKKNIQTQLDYLLIGNNEIKNSEQIIDNALRENIIPQIENISSSLDGVEEAKNKKESLLDRLKIIKQNCEGSYDWSLINEKIKKLNFLLEKRVKQDPTDIEKTKAKWEERINSPSLLKSECDQSEYPNGVIFDEVEFKTVCEKINVFASLDLAPIAPQLAANIDSKTVEAIQAQINLVAEQLAEVKRYLSTLLTPDLASKTERKVVRTVSHEKIESDELAKAQKEFREFYNKVSWEQIDKTKLDNALVYPKYLKENFVALRVKQQQLFKIKFNDEFNSGNEVQNFEDIIRQNYTDYSVCLDRLKKYIKDLVLLKINLETYLKNYESYIKQNHAHDNFLVDLERRLIALEGMLNTQDKLEKDNSNCEQLIEQLEEVTNKVYLHRSRFNALESGMSLNPQLDEVNRAIQNLEAEEQYKKDIDALTDKITGFKTKKANYKREAFSRFMREFLYTGKSAEIIHRLKQHMETNHRLKNGALTAKGELISHFLEGLFSAKRINNITDLKNYLHNGNNQDLIKNTKSGWFSTSGDLLSELRKALMELDEEEGRIETIELALNSENQQIEDECLLLLNNLKKSERVNTIIPSFDSETACEGYTKSYLYNKQPTEADCNIQRDLVMISGWESKGRYDYASRQFRMECTIALRDPQLKEKLQDLQKQDPFIFAYQKLRIHLENCQTANILKMRSLWSALDELAFSDESKEEKYNQMKRCVLRHYRGIREATNGSAGFFFGKGSKLGDALETFLVTELGYTKGEAPGQVSHRRPDTDFIDKALHWTSDHMEQICNQLFSCGRRR